MKRRLHVCSTPGCPRLTPCAVHGRPRNARWSERDPKLQGRWRAGLMLRAGGVCERCHAKVATVAHHVRPGYELEDGLALCDPCHMAVDDKARKTKETV